MLTVAEALDAVLEQAGSCRRSAAHSPKPGACVLAEDAVADTDSPPFDKALVDGTRCGRPTCRARTAGLPWARPSWPVRPRLEAWGSVRQPSS